MDYDGQVHYSIYTFGTPSGLLGTSTFSGTEPGTYLADLYSNQLGFNIINPTPTLVIKGEEAPSPPQDTSALTPETAAQLLSAINSATHLDNNELDGITGTALQSGNDNSFENNTPTPGQDSKLASRLSVVNRELVVAAEESEDSDGEEDKDKTEA